jgi:hypothetical protein
MRQFNATSAVAGGFMSVYPMKHLFGFLLWQPFEYRPARQTVLHFADTQIALQVGQGDHEEDAKEQQQDQK